MLKRSHISFLFVATCFFIIIVLSTFNKDLTSVSLYIIIPILSLNSIIKYRKEILKFKPLIILLVLFLWMLLSGLIADDINLYFTSIKRILGVVLLCILIFCFSLKGEKYVYMFYLFYCIKFAYMFIYAANNNLLNTSFSSTRFNLVDLNANTFGYFAFFAITSSFLLLLENETKKIRPAIWILIIFCIITGLVSVVLAASRAGFLLISASILVFSIVYFIYPFSWKSFFFITVIAGILIFSINKAQPILEDSILFKRLGQTESDSRLDLFKGGIEVGLNKPLFGTGTGNLVKFVPKGTHSSYAELLGSNGIVGFLLFVVLLLESLRKSYNFLLINRLDSKTVFIYLAFFMIYIVYNFFYWFYAEMFMLGFFFLVRTNLELHSIKVDRSNV